MKYIFNSNYGNFTYEMAATIDEATTPSPLAASLIVQGLANIAYRVAGSAVDKALEIDPKAGRRSVEYSEEAAEKINASVAATIAKLEKAEKDPLPEGITFEVTGQHVFGEGAGAMVRATAFVDALLKENEEKLRMVLGLYDEDAATTDREGLIAIAHKAGVGLQTPKAKK